MPREVGRNSASTIPAKINPAPNIARRPICSPKNNRDVSHANTGSSVKISAVCDAGRCCWAQLWIVKAAAVASTAVTPSAAHTIVDE